jgi:hypothetical protein
VSLVRDRERQHPVTPAQVARDQAQRLGIRPDRRRIERLDPRRLADRRQERELVDLGIADQRDHQRRATLFGVTARARDLRPVDQAALHGDLCQCLGHGQHRRASGAFLAPVRWRPLRQCTRQESNL